jgi:hypothetical protein
LLNIVTKYYQAKEYILTDTENLQRGGPGNISDNLELKRKVWYPYNIFFLIK